MQQQATTANVELDKLKSGLQQTIDTLQTHFNATKKEILFAFGVPAIISAAIGLMMRAPSQALLNSSVTSSYAAPDATNLALGLAGLAGAMFVSLIVNLAVGAFSAYWNFRFIEKLHALLTVGSYEGFNFEKSKSRFINYFLMCGALIILCGVGAVMGGLPALAVMVLLPLCPLVAMLQNINVIDSLKVGFDLAEGNRLHILFVSLILGVAIGMLAWSLKAIGTAVVPVLMLGYVTWLLNLYVKASSTQTAKLAAPASSAN